MWSKYGKNRREFTLKYYNFKVQYKHMIEFVKLKKFVLFRLHKVQHSMNPQCIIFIILGEFVSEELVSSLVGYS